MPERVELQTLIPVHSVVSGQAVVLDVRFTDDERRKLCERFGFSALSGLDGRLVLSQLADECWSLKGRLDGQVTQACVVSGKAVVSPLVVDLDERFVKTLSEQTDVDATDVDVDVLVDGQIPVGESLSQWIGVCAPAWPRANDVPVLEEPALDPAENHPFAKLSELKK